MGKAEIYIPGMEQVSFGPGAVIPNAIYCNLGRCLTGEAVFHQQEILCDIAGGVPATFPFEQDIANPELAPFMEKYLKRNPDISVEDQMRFWLYFGDMTVSSLGGAMNYGSYHGGGSPIMEQIAIAGQYDIEARKAMVPRPAGMSKKG